jgi:Tfp pilus assembly protein PilX
MSVMSQGVSSRGTPAQRRLVRLAARLRVPTRLRDQRGTALVLALLVVAVLSISTAAIATLVSSNETAYGRDRQELIAFDSAEAGLNYGIATLAKSIDPSGLASVGATASGNFPNGTGTGTWTATKIAKTTWRITSDAWSANGRVERELRENVQSVTQPGTITPASLVWSYGLFVANPTSCFSPQGSANMTISIYVNGDLCLNGSANIAEPSDSTGPSVQVFATGKITLGNSNSIGAANRKVYSVTAVKGCTGSKGILCSKAGSNVYASQYNVTGTPLTKPAVYPNAVYASGDWMNPTCSTGSFTFDNDSTRNSSVSGVNLFPATSYNCSVHAPGDPSTIVGTLAWNATTKVLSATGVIYIDGDMSIQSNTQVSYGNGTFASIYFNGAVTTNGGSALCGPPSYPSGSVCAGTKWDASKGALVFVVVNSGGVTPAWKANGNAEFDIAAYVVGNYNNGGNAFITGPVVCDTASVGGSSDSTDVSNPPPGTPGSSTTSPGQTDWSVISGTWEQRKPS